MFAWVNWPARAAALVAVEFGLQPAPRRRFSRFMSAPTSTNSPRCGSSSDEGSLCTFGGADALTRAWTGGLKPDAYLTVSDWADQHRGLASRASSEPGRYRTRRTSYMEAIMDALSAAEGERRTRLGGLHSRG